MLVCMRKFSTIPGEYYHVFNRGNNKQPIFLEEADWIRFLFLVLYFQSKHSFTNISFYTSHFNEHRVFNISRKTLEKILKNRSIELVNFALMPNHFHLLMRELVGGGISKYMQKVLNAYTKYFNAKYNKVGHLFQEPFKIVWVESNEQLLYLSAYIHRNPREIKEWKNREHKFPWSSFQDYATGNRWGRLLKQDIILDQISFGNEYKDLVDSSGAKDPSKKLDDRLLID